MIEDMKKRQAALEQSDRAAAGKAAKAPVPAVVQPSPAPVQPTPAAKPTPTTRDAAPPTPTTPATRPVPSQVPRGVELVSSNYTVAERGQAFWRLSWRTSVRNQQRTPIRVRVEMDFRDGKGAVISTGEQTVNINGGAAADVTGSVSMKAIDGPRVASATPRITLLK